jgi:polysaccharide pyruvyl transferase WcaK-like protein
VLLTCTYVSLYVMVGSVWFSRLELGSGTRHLQRWMVPRIETFSRAPRRRVLVGLLLSCLRLLGLGRCAIVACEGFVKVFYGYFSVCTIVVTIAVCFVAQKC